MDTRTKIVEANQAPRGCTVVTGTFDLMVAADARELAEIHAQHPEEALCVVVLPLAIRIIAATAQSIPADLIDAATNLGAGPLALARHILAPLLLPGLMASALLSFIASLEEFLLSFVVGMPTIQTLPMLLWAYLGGRSAILSYAAVVTVALLIPTLLVLVVVERFLKQEYLAAGFGKA